MWWSGYEGKPTVRTVWHNGNRSRNSDSPSVYGPTGSGSPPTTKISVIAVLVEPGGDLLDMFPALDESGSDVRNGVVAAPVQVAR